MKRTSVLVLGLLTFIVGCSTEKRLYEVSVKNELDKPITVWLVKQNGPMEAGWESPELIGLEENPPAEDKLPDVIVPPGKTAVCGPVQGIFDKDRGRAYLRVYSGTPTLAEMLAIGRGSLSRTDVLLEPSAPNAFEVEDHDGLLNVDKVAASPTTHPAH